MWTIYKNINGNSGVSAYETGIDFIRIKFRSGSVYKYTFESTGVDEVEQMKMLAESGEGLSTFINKYVKKNYAEKEQ
jgi:hypothetical protein